MLKLPASGRKGRQLQWLGPVLALSALAPASAWAFPPREQTTDALTHPLAIAAVLLFLVAYLFVIFEEVVHLPKSKPMINAAGIMWVLAAIVGHQSGMSEEVLEAAVTHNLEEYAALFLFLLVAMIYINALEERNVFQALKGHLVSRGLNYTQLFWATGGLAFLLSPFADNLTTALIMGAVVMAVGKDSPKFIAIACVNIVVAANAGGAFSPFGDITTLMVWQSGKASFFEFFYLVLPATATWLATAFIMVRALPDGQPQEVTEHVEIKRGGLVVTFLFVCTIIMAISFENFFGLPPYLGMMTGLSFLFLFIWLATKTAPKGHPDRKFETFTELAHPEWDTLLFFFGVMYCVGALSFIGYLGMVSDVMYGQWGASIANIVAGALSAVIDNIPVMFAILTMNPEMDLFQWLLITLTAGVGGSMLSVGSAAGVALMGSAKGHYTFMTHLKWTWAVAVGYAAGIAVHFAINGLLL